jgi:soluble lytic murein transglycosylase
MRQFDECLQELPANAEPEFKAAICAADENYQGAIRAVSHDLDGTPSQSWAWQMAYPREFAEYVAQGAQANNLDPLLIHALIREESRYNVMAISRSKAIGLTQLMPGTAYGVAKRLGIPLSGTADVFKPDINIKLGSNYLAYVLKRAQENALMAVASYNGGPGAVQQWLKQHAAAGYPDFDYFVENIGFRETRDYVRKVFASYWNYERVYSQRPQH